MDKKREALILHSSEKEKQGKKKSSIIAQESNQELFHMSVHTISTHLESLHIRCVHNTRERSNKPHTHRCLVIWSNKNKSLAVSRICWDYFGVDAHCPKLSYLLISYIGRNLVIIILSISLLFSTHRYLHSSKYVSLINIPNLNAALEVLLIYSHEAHPGFVLGNQQVLIQGTKKDILFSHAEPFRTET